MLTSIGDTIGEMGGPGMAFTENIRTLSAPQLDMDSPDSMAAYSEYLRRNGREAEAMAMMEKAQARKLSLRQNEGKAQIMRIKNNMDYMNDPAAIRAAEEQISRIAQDYEIDATELAKLYEAQDIARRQATVAERGADTADFRADTERTSVDNQDTQFYAGLAQDAYQFGEQMDFKRSELAETQRLNTHRIWRGQEEIRQGDKSLSLDEARVDIARDLANEDITMGEFKRVIMGNEDARAADMHPLEMQLKETQIRVATANAGYTEAQTEDVLYELGFKRDTEDLRKDVLELNVEKTEEEIKTERANRGYIKERTKQITAEVELGRDRYNLEERRLAWEQGLQEAEMKLNERIANSQIDLRQAQVNEIAASMKSTVLRDELLVAKAESEKISEAYKVAYTWPVDLNNSGAIANAKEAFIATYGKEFAMDFDDALQQRIKVQTLIDDTSQTAQLRADAKPKTVAQLEAAGMSPQDIDAYKLLTDPEKKNQYVQTWANRMNTPEKGAAPTKALMEIYAGAANRMREDLFGWDLPFGLDMDDVEQDVALAMASAAAAGKSSNDVWLAGLEATFPYLQEQGSASSALSADRYRQKYGGDK
jgi:hypothetical protein